MSHKAECGCTIGEDHEGQYVDSNNCKVQEAREYLTRLLKTVYPEIEPLSTLLGLCTQIDNGLAVPMLTPIPMLLFCPKCGLQHVDMPDGEWRNPPHRTHLCSHCGHRWRPCDRPTDGALTIQTKGENDGSPIPQFQGFEQRVSSMEYRVESVLKDLEKDNKRLRETLAAKELTETSVGSFFLFIAWHAPHSLVSVQTDNQLVTLSCRDCSKSVTLAASVIDKLLVSLNQKDRIKEQTT